MCVTVCVSVCVCVCVCVCVHIMLYQWYMKLNVVSYLHHEGM